MIENYLHKLVKNIYIITHMDNHKQNQHKMKTYCTNYFNLFIFTTFSNKPGWKNVLFNVPSDCPIDNSIFFFYVWAVLLRNPLM